MTQEQFERAVTEFRRDLIKYLRKLGRDRADADDIVQEALLQLIPKYEKFVGNNERAIRSWFYEAVKITNKQFGRKAGRDQKHVLHGQDIQKSRRREDENPHELWDPRDLDCPDDPAEVVVIRIAVREALKDFPPDIASAIWRNRAEGVSIPEIAKEMGVKAKTLTSMLRPWETTLQERLKDFAQAVQKEERDNIAS